MRTDGQTDRQTVVALGVGLQYAPKPQGITISELAGHKPFEFPNLRSTNRIHTQHP